MCHVTSLALRPIVLWYTKSFHCPHGSSRDRVCTAIPLPFYPTSTKIFSGPRVLNNLPFFHTSVCSQNVEWGLHIPHDWRRAYRRGRRCYQEWPGWRERSWRGLRVIWSDACTIVVSMYWVFIFRNKFFKEGYSPLILAASMGMHDMCDMLLEQGADLNFIADVSCIKILTELKSTRRT